MVYKFDPTYWNGTIFHLDRTWEMARGWMEYVRQNQPIPASYFPKTLTFDEAGTALPDIFHTARDIIVFSERAREVMEHWAPGQIEFIPVACHAGSTIVTRRNFASAVRPTRTTFSTNMGSSRCTAQTISRSLGAKQENSLSRWELVKN
jgi:hypothetical protein